MQQRKVRKEKVISAFIYLFFCISYFYIVLARASRASTPAVQLFNNFNAMSLLGLADPGLMLLHLQPSHPHI